MKKYKVLKSNIIKLKDGRKIASCGFGFHYWLIDKKGVSTPIKQSYYNNLLRLRKTNKNSIKI